MLERIDGPHDLRGLGPEELSVLADEIRSFVVAAVARTGGHLGSNLGAVELTLALHRVFDSPTDTLVFDTGHQTYVHKLVTGRRDGFARLRQAGGLSGYPSRGESPHDLVENSHASTSLSWASGLARGRALRTARGGEAGGHVVAVIGDGALTGGMAFEALNTLGHDRVPVLVVLNDNGRSYAPTVSRLAAEVTKLRTSDEWARTRRVVGPVLDRVPFAARVADAGLDAVKAMTSDAPALQQFVEALGVHYLGPYDGHDVAAVEAALQAATARLDGPVLVHVLTEKGRGYAPAETDREKRLHDTSAFDIATGRGVATKPRSWTQAFSDVLLDLAEERPDLVACTAAMPGSTGLLPLQERHPDRVLDGGIAEQHLVTQAAGLAREGTLPVVALYATFLSRAFDQTNLDVGLHGEHVVFCLDRAGITGDDGPSHHGVLDMALCLRIPGMSVLVPSSEQELVALLRTAVELDGPVVLRWPKGTAVQREDVGSGLAARRHRQGDDVAIVAVGDRLQPALDAAAALAEDGIEATVWDPRAVRPLDAVLLDDVAAHPLVVTVENGVVAGGAGAHVADRLVERTGVHAAPPVLRLGVPDEHLSHAEPDRILAELGLDGAGITAAIRKALDAA